MPKSVVLPTLALFSFAGTLPAPSANGAPARPAAQQANAGSVRALSFQVTARFAARDEGSNIPQPQQTFAAKVLVSGSRVRVETRISDRPLVFLITPPYLYKLLPSEKAGVRWRIDKQMQNIAASGFTFQTLLRDPVAVRAALRKGGAQRTGAGKLSGVPVDIYTARNFLGKAGLTRVWVRRSDALPVRLESNSKTLSSTISWRDYRRGLVLRSALFQSPVGYSIRDSRGQPNLL